MTIFWYQVYQQDGKVYGFKTDGNLILDHPDYKMKHILMSDFKKFHCGKEKIKQISKICEYEQF